MIGAFFQTEIGSLVYLTLLATVADLAVGIWAAVRDDTFQLSSVAAVLRKHVVGRVMPIFGLLLLGYLTGLTPLPTGLGAIAPPLFTAAGTGAAGLYILETLGSILEALKKQPTTTAATTTKTTSNVPTD